MIIELSMTVTFQYANQDDKRPAPQFGLIAEDVAEVNPDLVVRDAGGEPLEFLKEHAKGEQQDRRIQQQEATIAQLRKDVDALFAHLKEHDSKIQRVSDRIETANAASRMTLND